MAAFYQQPAGSVFELKRFQGDSVQPPPLSGATVAATEKVWDNFEPQLESLRRAGLPESDFSRTLEEKLWLREVMPAQIRLLDEWYSTALNDWGVELQRNGYAPAARRRFAQALTLDPANWVAQVNLLCNSNLQSGTRMTLSDVGDMSKHFGSLQQFGAIVTRYGPLDHPAFCYVLGETFQHAGFPRLALQQFERAHALVSPEILAPQFALADLYTRCRMDDQAMQAITSLRGKISKLPDYPALDTDLSVLEAKVCVSETNIDKARNILQSVCRRYPKDAKTLFPANLGLAEIALQQHDTNQAIWHYQQCLTNAVPQSAQWKSVRARLDSLVPATPARKA